MTDLSRVHLIGIGGSGMSGVAHILLDRGATVTGSDAKDSRPVRALKAKGAKVALGHAEANLELSGELPTAVVTSFAARRTTRSWCAPSVKVFRCCAAPTCSRS